MGGGRGGRGGRGGFSNNRKDQRKQMREEKKHKRSEHAQSSKAKLSGHKRGSEDDGKHVRMGNVSNIIHVFNIVDYRVHGRG